ncbi:band 4.1-like protein 4A isoform X2 [Ischnura elegans]|uniref:band 4.1-like protein 4A isoform X2 n=1 Tax=Ischnura elegans TaxID=197161 RepID=UPI001ED8962D|nr:band 4.1-like protein 4A isoform X2 [Ischnura elegans]
MRCFGKKVQTHHCKVVLLDEQELIQEIQDTTPGQEVLDTVFRHLNLLETAYFGLRYLDSSSQTHWLDPTKKVAKQLKGTDPFTLYFGVKFYAADPCKLLEEITRYQFFLQVKQDILQGRLPVSFDLAAELGSYVVQSELGDYDQRRHSPGYVSEFRFLSNQTVELESRIAELHKGLVGQIPAVAELNYLEKVKWLDMYGVDLHPVLGEDNVEYFLGLTPSGIIVLRNKTKVGNYYWPRITKVYFKGRYFMLRVCDKNSEENTYGFETPSKQACKHLWKCCVEHHAFFRLVQVSPPHAASSDAPTSGNGSVFSIGSRFSGRTEKQAQADAQMRLRSPPQFTRTPSRRYQRRIVEGAQDMPTVEEIAGNENIPPQEMKSVSIPQPVSTVTSMYRSTSIPSVLPRSDSPRSIRSAPWSAATHGPTGTVNSGVSMTRGLYSGASPRSVRSAPHHPPNTQLLSRLTRRSSSVESQSSVDSRSCKRHHHHHRSRRGSDNDSEVSKSSCRSHSHRRHRSHHKRDSGSETDQHHRHRHRSYKHRHGSNYELVDSEAQWKEVQRKQAEGQSGIHQATVIKDLGNRRSGYLNSGMETESELSYHHKRKHKKHRSRSRSPSETKARLPDELKKHLEFDLIETEGMTVDQLREIPYKAVETDSKPPKIKYSPNSKRRQRSPRRSKSSTLDERCQPPNSGDSPPPPYSPPKQGGLGPGPPNGNPAQLQETPTSPLRPSGESNANLATTNPAMSGSLADLLKNSNPSTTNHSPAGSVRSNHLPRAGVPGSLHHSPSIPPSGHSSHRQAGLNYSAHKLTNSIYTPGITFSSALYGNAGKLLGNGNIPNGHVSSMSISSGLSQKNHDSAYHEHSDSGLGADSQDYVYSGRTSESSRYLQTSRISAAFTKPVSTSKTYPTPSPLAAMKSGQSGHMAFKSSQPLSHHSLPPHKHQDRHGTTGSNRSLGNHTNPIDDLKQSHHGLGGWLSPEHPSPRHMTYSPSNLPTPASQRQQNSANNSSQHYARRPQLPLPSSKSANQNLLPPPSPSAANYNDSWDDAKSQQTVGSGGAGGGGNSGGGGVGETPALGPRGPTRLAGSMRSVRSGPAGADGGWSQSQRPPPIKDSNKTNATQLKSEWREDQIGRQPCNGSISSVPPYTSVQEESSPPTVTETSHEMSTEL